MILYLLLLFFDKILMFVINLIPVFTLPTSLVASVGTAFEIMIKFNLYLPISDIFICLVLILTFSLNWKVVKAVLSKVGINF